MSHLLPAPGRSHRTAAWLRSVPGANWPSSPGWYYLLRQNQPSVMPLVVPSREGELSAWESVWVWDEFRLDLANKMDTGISKEPTSLHAWMTRWIISCSGIDSESFHIFRALMMSSRLITSPDSVLLFCLLAHRVLSWQMSSLSFCRRFIMEKRN